MKTPVERKAIKRLLDERNPALAQRIDALHRNGSQIFAAVGSMHLFGPAGLPTLMEKKGYKVERVTFPAPKTAASAATSAATSPAAAPQ